MHDKLRQNCRACRGSNVCKHDKLRHNCRICRGSNFCEHGKERYHCAECQNLPCTMEGCPQFGHRFSSASKLLKHMRAYHSGQPKALTKSKELSVYQALQTAGIAFEYQKHLPFHGCDMDSETKCAYVDFALTAPWGALLLEVDEDQHSGRPASCDPRRDFDMCASLALGSGHKVAVLRFNPDNFRMDGKNKKIATKDRHRRLVEVVRAWLTEDPAPDKQLARFFMYYDCRSDSPLPVVAKEWDKEACAVSALVP